MVLCKCPNDDCGKEWEYNGDKSHPKQTSCPDCGWRVRIPKEA